MQDISCRLKNILQRDFGILNDDIEKPGRIEDHHLTKALNILKEKRRQVKNVSIGSISQVFIMNKGAYLASAPCHNTGCFLPCPKVRAYFGHPGTKCLEFPKWHWLILAPMGALDYEYWAGLFVRFEFCCVVCFIISSDGLDIAKQFVKIPMPICLAWFIWNAKVSDIYLSVLKDTA